MLPEDDYLRLKPLNCDHRAIQRIAMMALLGCLLLMSALVMQAGAATRHTLKPPVSQEIELPRQSPVPGLDMVSSAVPSR